MGSRAERQLVPVLLRITDEPESAYERFNALAYYALICIDSQCVYGRILPCIFVLILVEVLKDALQPNFQQVEDR